MSAALSAREKKLRRTWFWTRLFFSLLFITVAAIIYHKTGRTVLALIFGVAGLIELVNVFVTPFGRKKSE